jgi:cobalt-zinc-cadmium efflux system outer membrane protein
MYKYLYLILWIASSSIYSEKLHHNKKCIGNQPVKNIIECVLDHSPEYRIAKADLEASLGRRRIASYTFPSNPVFSASTAHRNSSSSSILSASPSNATNGEILLSQEVFIGGQREVKIELAQSDIKTKIKKIHAIERNTISQTVNAALVFQAAWEEYKLTQELNLLSKEIAKIATLRFKNGIGAEMDSEIAVSESIKMNSMEELTKRRWQDAKTDLVVMMGIDFAEELQIREENRIFNVPIEDMDRFVQLAESRRPDLEVLELEIQYAKNRIRLLQREKIPNLTFSGFVQNDGFNERVVGGRISIPLQIWRDNSGEIKEAQALSKISEERKEVGTHTVRFEAIKAWNSKDSWKRAWINFPPNIMERTNENLNILKDAISTGKISVKDALVTQRSLIELKANYFQTKAGYAISCNEYLRAGGIDLNEFFLMEKKHENKN